jgi:hypothetical protein
MMNYLWSLLGYQTENVNESGLKAELTGTIDKNNNIKLSTDHVLDSFSIISFQKKKNNVNEYRVQIELNQETKLGEWFAKFGGKNWKRVDEFRTTHMRWRSNKGDLFLLYSNQSVYKHHLERDAREPNQTIITYTDDEKKEYAILILQE